MFRSKEFIIVYILVSFFLPAGTIYENSPKEKEIQIYANVATYTLNKKIIEFQGNVNVQDGEFFIHSNKLTIYLDDDNKIITIHAKKDISLSSKKINARCEFLIYNTKKQLITLIDNAQLEYILKKKSQLKSVGEKIIYNIKTGLIEN